MDAMDLLRSLTQGVNNKVVKDDDTDSVEYVVKTSLRGKSVEEVSNEKEQSFEEEIFVEEEFVDNFQEEFVDNFQEEFVDNFQEEFVDNLETEDNIYESGHKLEEEEVIKEEIVKEEIVVKIPEKRKIDRGGNPFKRGPRKSTLERLERERLEKERKEKEKLEQEEQKLVEKEKKEEKKYEDNVPDFSDSIEEKFDYVDEMIKESVREHVESEDLIDDLTYSSENNITDVDIEETEETDIEELGLEIDEDIMYMEEKDFEESPIAETIQKLEKKISESMDYIENTKDKEEVENITDIENEEKNLKESVLDTIEDNIVEEEGSKVEDIPTNKSFNEEEKYANCIYRPGMEVEEFLRVNPNYREALYVEHFFSKDTLTRLLNSGIILLKKGKYRM